MLLELNDVLTPAAASELCVELEARRRAEPAPGRSSFADDVSERVHGALAAHPLFLLGTRPDRVTPARFDVYRAGDAAGWSVDAAVQGAAGERGDSWGERRLRVDVTVTLFLSDPSSYEGGELCIDTGCGEEMYKPAAGACVARPAAARHRVERVRSGSRCTAELWLQSLVRGPSQREILYDVACSEELLGLFAGQELAGQQQGAPWAAELESLRRCHQNLLRLWAEP